MWGAEGAADPVYRQEAEVLPAIEPVAEEDKEIQVLRAQNYFMLHYVFYVFVLVQGFCARSALCIYSHLDNELSPGSKQVGNQLI